jgi:hypothetical protein
VIPSINVRASSADGRSPREAMLRMKKINLNELERAAAAR